jgi:hypothetical protein
LLFQDILIERIIFISIVQIWPIFYGSYFAYKILKRAKNKLTEVLSSFFLLTAITYLLVYLSVFTLYWAFSFLIYVFGTYIFIFSQGILVVFSWLLINLDKKITWWKISARITFYVISAIYVILFAIYFNGIRYDSSTNWIPTFSWEFLIVNWSYLIVFIVIPQVILSYKMIIVFEGVILKRRIQLFIISVFLEFLVVFFVILYNTWIENELYRVFHRLFFPPITFLAAYLVYQGFGKELV